jgi:hypothetical protein
MSSNKLFKMLEEPDKIASKLDDDQKQKIVQDVLLGVKIDDDSRSEWLETNKEAMRIIKHCEENTEEDTLDTPVYKAAKVIYPLLANAVIQLASRMIVHVVRNDKVAEMSALGKDMLVPENPEEAQRFQQIMQMVQQNPQIAQQLQQSGQMPPQPKMVWKKKDRAKRVTDYMNYKFLIESDTWLKDTHKLCHIVASWGTGFRQVYYDRVSKRTCNDLIPPEDIIINHNISCLEKAPRVTIRHYLSKNDSIEQIRAGYFLDIEEELNKAMDDRDQNSMEIDPAMIVYCQYVNLDLDDDGYAEPYKVYVHEKLQKLLRIEPAFDFTDITLDAKGKVLKINRVLDIVDDHLIDDPEGKFYSIGLNYLLLHQNKSITAIQRQLLDAGTLANAASCTGFITNAFKTRERDVEFTLGEYKQIDVNPNVNPQQHVIPLPAREPSQVLMGLLQMLIEGAEKTGFITDVLTGDIAGQNVPATTMLSMVEQGTRAFKPIIQKFWISRKKEFKLWFKIQSKSLNEDEYVSFHDSVVRVGKEDFNLEDLDVCPVADPTQSSESHKYAKMQFILQLLATQAMPVMNVQENLIELYKGMEFDDPERFVSQPQPPPPDPKMEKVKLDAAKMQQDFRTEQMKLQLESLKIENEKMKLLLKKQEVAIKADESYEKQRKMIADAHRGMAEASIKDRMADVAEDQVEIDRERIEVMKLQARAKANKPKE